MQFFLGPYYILAYWQPCKGKIISSKAILVVKRYFAINIGRNQYFFA